MSSLMNAKEASMSRSTLRLLKYIVVESKYRKPKSKQKDTKIKLKRRKLTKMTKTCIHCP